MVESVSPSAAVEVRAIGEDSFEEIYPLLLEFDDRRMGKEDWRRMLFTYPWCSEPYRGYALFAEGEAVGFMGTIFCSRTVAGRNERFCNTSAWIVREPYRHASVLLLKPLLALRDHTILQLTPNSTSHKIFLKLGFKELESEQLLLPPIPSGIADMKALAGGSFVTSRESLLSELTGEEKAIYRDLAGATLTRHVLLRRGDRRCYVVATPSHRKGVVFADVHYIGDREFFWDNRLLAHAAFFRAMGAAALAVDSRFAQGCENLTASRRPARRLYRPSRPEITPLLVDGLYSEWMFLRQ
jgi:hypothetical protein